MKALIFISFTFFITLSASAQKQSASASQQITIKIQRATRVDFSSILHSKKNVDNVQSSQASEKMQNEADKDIIVASSHDKTYVRPEDLEELPEEPIAVVTKTAL